MRRREYLAFGGSVLITGCTGEEGGVAATLSPTPQTGTPTPSWTQTHSATPDGSTDTPESSTDTPESTPTETETQTPNTPTEVESLIEAARNSLSEAVVVYAEFAPLNRDGIISITAETTNFSASDVFQPANTALRSLNEAEDSDRQDEHTGEIAILR